MSGRVSVWKYVRIGKKWRYCKPAVGKNGKIKPDRVIVKGKEEHHPEGNFYLHRYEGDKEIWKKMGPNAQEAVNGRFEFAEHRSHDDLPVKAGPRSLSQSRFSHRRDLHSRLLKKVLPPRRISLTC